MRHRDRHVPVGRDAAATGCFQGAGEALARHLLLFPVMTLLLLSLLGCIDETGCTEIAVYSTTIALVDEAGAPIEGATLTYTVDGEEPPLPCEELSGGDYVCGIEADGHFVISAAAPGFEAGQAVKEIRAQVDSIFRLKMTL